MQPAPFLGAISGLTAALCWGSGDFIGGLATRRIRQYQVVALAAVSGLVIFIPAAVLRRELIPSAASMAWALAAGFSGAVGVAALYAGLAQGPASLVAPTATVVGASMPVVLGALLYGLPRVNEGAGIALGLLGIWLVSRPSEPGGGGEYSAFPLALAAGAGFGGYFILIAQIDPGPIFFPLAAAKLAALLLSGLVLKARGQRFPALESSRPALAAGAMDAGGNLFHLLAAQQAGIAVAAVLASMAPATTVLLSVRFLGERLHRPQAMGVALCLASVGLTSLRT